MSEKNIQVSGETIMRKLIHEDVIIAIWLVNAIQ